MRVSLIEPAPPGFHIYSFIKQVRLGLPLLGTLLRDLGHEVSIFAEALGEVDWSRVYESDLVGVSTITSTAMKAYRYAEQVRQAGIPVVMGGPHVTFEPDEALEFADYVVRGEGEETLIELLDHLHGRRSLESIGGLSYQENGRHRHNPARPLIDDLSRLPAPDMSLIEHHDKIRPTPFLTSRGCPFDCEFCSVILMFGRRVRTIDSRLVIEAIKAEAPRQIFFYDDNFLITKRRGREFLVHMIREGLSIPFSAQIRVDSICKDGKVDHELLRLLREAGCFLVYLGLESVNPATLAAYNKRQSVDDIARGLRALHDYGIRTHGMFVFGSDADTVESLAETVDFAIEHNISTVQFLVLTPLPGTRQWEQLEREQRIFTKNWTLYDGHHVVFWPKQMSPLELLEATVKGHVRFYRANRIAANPKHRLEGFLMSHLWSRIPENMAYVRELKALTANEQPPASVRA